MAILPSLEEIEARRAEIAEQKAADEATAAAYAALAGDDTRTPPSALTGMTDDQIDALARKIRGDDGQGERWRTVDDVQASDGTEPFLDPVDLDQLMAGDPPDPEEWAVNPLFPKGRSTAIASTRGDGKSLFLLDVVARYATGEPVLDQPGGPPRQTVYIDQEMGVADLHERLTDLGWTPDHPKWAVLVAHLHYYQLIDLPPLDTEEGGWALEGIIDRHNAEMVILDTIGRMISGEENSADTFRHLDMHTGRRLRRKGVTVGRADHLGKDTTRGPRGSSAKADTTDIEWVLRKPNDTTRTLTRTKGRQQWIPERVTVVLIDTNGVLEHQLVRDVTPQWAIDLAYQLDMLAVPAEAGVTACQKALKAAGRGRRRSDIELAVRYRKSNTRSHVPTPGTTTRDTPVHPPGTPPRDTPGHPPTETDVDQGKQDGTPLGTPPDTLEGGSPTPKGGTPPQPDGDIEGAEDHLRVAGFDFSEVTPGPPPEVAR
jgi:hypothetical protein